MRPIPLLAVALLTASLLTACGTEPSDPDGSSPGDVWQTQRLDATPGPDASPVFVTDGDDALLLTVSEDGELVSHVSVEGADFERGTPLDAGVTYLELGDAVRLPDGDWYVLGSGGLAGSGNDERMLFEPHAFRSADGLSWEEVDVDGFTDAVDIGALEVVDGTIVVAGTYRTAKDPGMGGFEAHAWTSADGERFTRVDLPGVPAYTGYRTESYAGHAAVVGDRLLVGGRTGRDAALWATDDAGATWQQVGAGLDVYDLSSLTVVGDTVLAGVAEGRHTAYASTDAGDSWSAVEALRNGSEDGAWAPVWAGGAGFWTLTGVDEMRWSRPEVCYADLDQCGKNPGPRLVTSADGDSWTAVDLDGSVDEVVGTADGRTLVLTGDGDGMAVHELAAGTTPPEAADPVEPETVELVTLGEDEEPVVGTRYHAPMYLHCGMTHFWFGGKPWGRTDRGPDIETGAGDDSAPTGWPYAQGMLYGYATVTGADHLEYTTADGEVIATYERIRKAYGCA
ncbi:MAG: hypothetical protein ACI379_05005 [Nocardioides sp.]|uniref:WD40/YVTN/BNR-like repeat-containing protein n=1 Tax=Nocardioides sp. TaxID=35761 RepID=UPI003F0894F9